MKSILNSIFTIWVLCSIAPAGADTQPPAPAPAPPAGEGKSIDQDQADRACREGMTIYCLALGMAEERTGRREEAMVHYRLACENHSTSGHLRACTPLLSLALELHRLDEAAVPLEKKCRDGSSVTCFYLGKEYLKILEYARGAKHLEPLCRSGFEPPDPQDYGPCYHLARGWEAAGELDRARELYAFDCNRDPEKAQPSCAALEALAIVQKKMVEQPWTRTRDWEWPEVLLLALVAMPFVSLLAGVLDRRSPRSRLRRWAPVAVLVLWGLWEVVPKQYAYHPGDRILAVLCLVWTLGLVILERPRGHTDAP